jgi:hypothetical protein
LVPLAKIVPNATKHLSMWGKTPFFLYTVAAKIVQIIKIKIKPTTHANVDHKI